MDVFKWLNGHLWAILERAKQWCWLCTEWMGQKIQCKRNWKTLQVQQVNLNGRFDDNYPGRFSTTNLSQNRQPFTPLIISSSSAEGTSTRCANWGVKLDFTISWTLTVFLTSIWIQYNCFHSIEYPILVNIGRGKSLVPCSDPSSLFWSTSRHVAVQSKPWKQWQSMSSPLNLCLPIVGFTHLSSTQRLGKTI